MKWSHRAFLTVGLLALAVPSLPGQTGERKHEPSPTKPAPTWLKIIDQGQNDPRLKGYLTPEGLKVEIVAEYPTVVNPVGMTFAEDGAPFVLEWRPDIGGSTFPEKRQTVPLNERWSEPTLTSTAAPTCMRGTIDSGTGKMSLRVDSSDMRTTGMA